MTDKYLSPLHLEPSDYWPAGIWRPTVPLALLEEVRKYGEEALPPIKARPHPTRSGHYELLVGYLAWRTACAANIEKLAVQVVDANDALAQLLVEHDAQSKSLDPVSRATGFERAVTDMRRAGIRPDIRPRKGRRRIQFSFSELARQEGLHRSTISHLRRVARLEPNVKRLIEAGKMSALAARPLVGLSPALQNRGADYFTQRLLSVRGLAKWAAEAKKGRVLLPEIVQAALKTAGRQTSPASINPPQPWMAQHARGLQDRFRCPVEIRGLGKGRIQIILDFYSVDEVSGFYQEVQYTP